MSGWYDNPNDICGLCNTFVGAHRGLDGACPTGPAFEFSYTSKFTKKGAVESDPFNKLCKNCGERFGEHFGKYSGCPNDPSTFVAVNPPTYQPMGWHPNPSVTAALSVANTKQKEKADKTKPWDTKPKFNTPKSLKGDIKYYKEAPAPKKIDLKTEIEDFPDFPDIPKETITQLKYYQSVADPPKGKSITWKDMTKFAESMADVYSLKGNKTASGAAMLNQQVYGRGLRGLAEGMQEPPIEALAEAYLKTNATTKTLVQMLVGFAQSAENPAVRKLMAALEESGASSRRKSERLERTTQQRDEWHVEWKKRGKEIDTLADKMATMVPKAVAKVPRAVEGNARKFRDA